MAVMVKKDPAGFENVDFLVLISEEYEWILRPGHQVWDYLNMCVLYDMWNHYEGSMARDVEELMNTMQAATGIKDTSYPASCNIFVRKMSTCRIISKP